MNFTLEIAYSESESKFIVLDKAYYTIGRNKDCDIQINNKFISSIHFTLVIAEESNNPYCLIIDGFLMSGEKSTNGVWINGKRIDSARLKHQDLISFGVTYPRLHFYTEFLEEIKDTETYEKTD